ncbi:MAG: ABC transporter permease subunit, partial [Phycisphaerales bacterium]|nr:ABC transporter permease subunit [Phycisphaerales bacterium]
AAHQLKGYLLTDAKPRRLDIKSRFYLQLPFGRSVLAGGLTLMLVILPIVIVSAQESLRAVPDSIREAALAVGATKWQMVSKTTLPAAIPGIMTGSILAMSRAMGEAAPILVIGGILYITYVPENLMDGFTVMPLQIYNWVGRPQEEFHKVAATGIIVLLVVLLSFNTVA